jgi:putative Holliday junction resolvase
VPNDLEGRGEVTASLPGDQPNIPPVGRLLGLDVGDRRIGLAVCDETQLLARPLVVITRGSRAEDLERLRRVIDEQEAVALVVGHPLNADDSEGPQGRRVASYARRLAATLKLPLLLWDEHGSTQEAARRLTQVRRSRRQTPLDAEAAAVILQDYLDQRRRATDISPPSAWQPDLIDNAQA